MIITNCCILLLLSSVVIAANTPNEPSSNELSEKSSASKATDSLLADTPLDLFLSQSPSSLAAIVKAHLSNCAVHVEDPNEINVQLKTVYEHIAHEMQEKTKGEHSKSNGCGDRVERDAMKLYKAIRTEHKVEELKRLSEEDKLKDTIKAKDEILTYSDTETCRQQIHDRAAVLIKLTCDDREWVVNRRAIESAAKKYLERKKKDATLTLDTFLEKYKVPPYIDDFKVSLHAAVQHQVDVPAAAHGHYLQITKNDDIREVERLNTLDADAKNLEVLADVIKGRPGEAMDYIWLISKNVQKLLEERMVNKKHVEELVRTMLTVVKGELAQREELMSSMTERDAITFINDLIHRQAYNPEDTRSLSSMDHRIRELIMTEEEPNIEKWAKEIYDKMMEHLGRWSWYNEKERGSYVSSFVEMHDPKAVETFKANLRSKVLDMVAKRKLMHSAFDVDQVLTVTNLAKHVYDNWKDPPNFNQLNLIERDLLLETMIPRPTEGKDARLIQIGARVAAERMLRNRFEMLKECDGKDASAPYFALLQTAVPITLGGDADTIVAKVMSIPVSQQAPINAAQAPLSPKNGGKPKQQKLVNPTASHLSGSCESHVKNYLILQVRDGIFQLGLTQNITPIMLRVNDDAELVSKHMFTNGIDSVDSFIEDNYKKESMSYKHMVKVQALNLYKKSHK